MMWCLQMLLSNSYILYKKYTKMHDLEAISHFDFNQQVCMAWIDPDNHWPKNKLTYQARDSSVQSATCSTSYSSDFMQRAPRFTDKYLNSITGSLSRRLEESKTHWPIPTAKLATSCQLHHWALSGKKKKRASLIYFSYCKVTLCSECFVPFHTNPQLVDAKRSMAIRFSYNDDGATRRSSDLYVVVVDMFL